MTSRRSVLFIILWMVCYTPLPKSVEGADPERRWQAYRLTGGSNAANGYQWLLISRLKLEELAKLDASSLPPPILDSSAVWIETHGKNVIWNSDHQPIKVPPPIKNFKAEEQLVLVGGVEYQVEPVPLATAIRLLKEPNGPGRIHRLLPPLAGMERTAQALLAALESQTDWQTYLLTGGPYAESGVQRLLFSQLSLQELATLKTPNIPQQDAPALWISIHGRDKNWTAVTTLEIAPPMTNFQSDKQLVMVDGVEYKLETVRVKETISLLRKSIDEEHIRKASGGPLYLWNRTAAALKGYVESKPRETDVPTRLRVGSSFGGERSVITSTIAETDPRSGTAHGLQLTLGPEKRLRELAVYDDGFLERRETYVEDGFQLVHEQFNRKSIAGGHGGNGYRWVDRRGMAGEPPATIAEGYLLDGKPWHGSFVFVESVPGKNPFESHGRLVWREYSEGKITNTKTDMTLGFGDLEKEQAWLKALPRVLHDS